MCFILHLLESSRFGRSLNICFLLVIWVSLFLITENPWACSINQYLNVTIFHSICIHSGYSVCSLDRKLLHLFLEEIYLMLNFLTNLGRAAIIYRQIKNLMTQDLLMGKNMYDQFDQNRALFLQELVAYDVYLLKLEFGFTQVHVHCCVNLFDFFFLLVSLSNLCASFRFKNFMNFGRSMATGKFQLTMKPETLLHQSLLIAKKKTDGFQVLSSVFHIIE